jgi:hypothetical protein
VGSRGRWVPGAAGAVSGGRAGAGLWRGAVPREWSGRGKRSGSGAGPSRGGAEQGRGRAGAGPSRAGASVARCCGSPGGVGGHRWKRDVVLASSLRHRCGSWPEAVPQQRASDAVTTAIRPIRPRGPAQGVPPVLLGEPQQRAADAAAPGDTGDTGALPGTGNQLPPRGLRAHPPGARGLRYHGRVGWRQLVGTAWVETIMYGLVLRTDPTPTSSRSRRWGTHVVPAWGLVTAGQPLLRDSVGPPVLRPGPARPQRPGPFRPGSSRGP